MDLKRTLSLLDSTSLMVTSIIGSGIFFTTGYLLNDISSPLGVLLCWFLGGLFAVSGALTYSYPAVLFPKAGGDYIYLKEAFSPVLAFMSGWSALLANLSANIAVLAIAFSDHFLLLFPTLKYTPFYSYSFGFISIHFGISQLIGFLLISFFTYINIRGITYAVRIQNFITFIKIGGLLLFIVLGFLYGTKDYSNFQTGEVTPKSIALGMVPVTFSYLGWNMITYLAGEVKDPERNIPLSILLACFLTIGIYLAINLLYLISAPISELKGNDGIGVISASHLFGKWVAPFFTIFILWMVSGSLSSILMGASRVYYAMAKDGVFFAGLSELHPIYQTPYKSILFQGIYASFLLIFGNIKSLIFMITCAVFLLSTLTALTVFKLKASQIKTSYKIPFYPLPPVLFSLGNLILIIYLTLESWQNTIWGLGISISGIPIYFLFKKKIIETP